MNKSASHLQAMMDNCALECTSHEDIYGQRVATWRSPRVVEDKLDYVLVSRDWCNAFVILFHYRGPQGSQMPWT